MSNKTDILLELAIKSLISLQDLALQAKCANKFGDFSPEEFAYVHSRGKKESKDGKSIDERAKDTVEEIQNVLNTHFMDDIIKEKFDEIISKQIRKD